jgi:hypothetical protein
VLVLAATPSARIEFIHDVLPSDDLVLEPNPPVRRDVGRARKPAGLLHPVKRGAVDGNDLQRDDEA